jgi:adenine-specific DNA-methyltransferase
LPYRINEINKKYVIFTKRGININDFPLTRNYLEKYKEILKKRYEVKKGLAKWYELAQVRNLHIYNAKTKIICPYRSRVPRFAIDKNQRYSSIDCTSLIPKESNFPDIYFILGVLNSELIANYLAVVAKKLDAKKIELYPKTLSQIPLKLPQTREDKALYNEIAEITKKICHLLECLKLEPEHHRILLKYGKKGLNRTGKDNQELLKLTESLDTLVYQFYGVKDMIDIFRNEIINS